MNTNNSRNSRKNSKYFLGMSPWGQETLLDEITGDEKSLDPVPLTLSAAVVLSTSPHCYRVHVVLISMP
jgi:hypothetical protein